ncbi:MAG: 2-oxo acid dehydrogenase subunit E2 [Verrucomicrobiota bacterium]
MRNVCLAGKQRLTSYRKIAIASWNHPRDPQTYASIDLSCEAAEKFIYEYPSDENISLTHFVVKILGHCFAKYPQFNHILRLNRLYERTQVNVFVTTLIRGEKGKDLSGFLVKDAAEQNLEEIARSCGNSIQELRSGEHPEMGRVQRMVDSLPVWLVRWMLYGQDFLQNTLNWDLRWLGVPCDPFGSVMLSNIGALGLESAHIPLSPYSRCPVMIGMGKPREVPVVREGEVVPGKLMRITFTFDHRHADGAHGAMVLRRFQKLFENPDGFRQVFEAS